MTRFLRSTALAAIVLSAPAFAVAATGGHDDAGLSADRARAAFTTAAAPAGGLSPGTSHDDATYAPLERAPAKARTAKQDRAEAKSRLAARCTCGHQS